MRPRWFLLAAAVVACGFAPAPFPKPEKKKLVADVQGLQGTWEIVSRHRIAAGGKLSTYGNSTVTRVRIEGERWSYVATDGPGGERVTVTYRLSVDNSKSPHWFDCVNEKNPKAAMRGLIQAESGTAKFVYRFNTTGTVERPLSMTEPSTGASVMVLKRLK